MHTTKIYIRMIFSYIHFQVAIEVINNFAICNLFIGRLLMNQKAVRTASLRSIVDVSARTFKQARFQP